MFKNFLEGFAIGLILKAFGKSIFIWVLVIFILLLILLVVFSMENDGADLSIFYTALGYAGRFVLFILSFQVFRLLLRNWKYLSLFMLVVVIVSFLPLLSGHGDPLDALEDVSAVVFVLAFVWGVDKLILKFQDRYKAIKVE